MRTIDRTTTFKKDFKREKKGQHKKTVEALLITVVAALADDQPLSPANRDHPLGGEWAGYRECHLKPDLLLMYSKPNVTTLQLVRLGSHSELFG